MNKEYDYQINACWNNKMCITLSSICMIKDFKMHDLINNIDTSKNA